MNKPSYRHGGGVWLLLGILGSFFASSALAADSTNPTSTAKTKKTEAMEEVVVTGSLIKGTPEDAALPVQVISSSDMQLSGSPGALDFVQSLTVSGPTTGASYYFSGAELSGDVGFNLRGLGPDKTLTLFNGRRLSGNTTSLGVAVGQANVQVLPSLALARVEILKDGAAVTYGADATGGVVNYITRKSFTGFKVSSSYNGYSGSTGEWNLGVLGGTGDQGTNIMWSAEWHHQSELDTQSRSVSSLPYGTNPAPWSILTNVSDWLALGALPAVPGNTTASEFGPTYGIATDFTQSSCEAVGGVYAPNLYPPSPLRICKYDYLPYYNLVEKSDTYKMFFQVNSAVSDNMYVICSGATHSLL